MNRGHKNYGTAQFRNSGAGQTQGLYLIRAENKLIKVGITQDIYARLSVLKGNSPLSLELIFWCDAGWSERILHKRFENKRSHGEWYLLEEDDIDWIKRFLCINEFLADTKHPVKIDRTRALDSYQTLI